MKIAIIGYGKMGKTIEPIAIERGHEIVLKVSKNSNLDPDDLNKADVAIEFTQPDSAKEHINFCFDRNIPVVVGTTGWYEDFNDYKDVCAKKNGCILPATNFSLGVNIFFEINSKLAQLMNHQNQYDVMVEEIHHVQKLDAPSGTAITISEGIIDSLDRKNEWKLNEVSNLNELQIKTLREPNVPGTHEVKYTSNVDEIALKHTAFNRQGFALGAVIAAEFIHGKTGVFSMKDVLKF